MKLTRFKVAKLIRDKQAEKMDKYGMSYKIHTMDTEEFKAQLNEKIMEEALEVTEATTKTDLTEELGDVFEVLLAIAKANEIDFGEVEKMRLAKRAEKGGFDDRVYNEYSEVKEGTEPYNYMIKNPHKYPLISLLD